MANNVQFDVRVDFSECVRYVDNLQRRHVPYVTAVTLTRLAQGSQKQIQAEMDLFFTLRSKKRMLAGVRILPAKKGDFARGTIHSSVLDKDSFMAIHTTGGVRRPEKHKYLSVPTDWLLGKGARTSSGAIKKQYKPATIIRKIKEKQASIRPGRSRKPSPFIMKIGSDHAVIAQRVGKERYPVNYLYGFEKDAGIKKAWPFAQTVAIYCSRYCTEIFSREFTRAVA